MKKIDYWALSVIADVDGLQKLLALRAVRKNDPENWYRET